MPAQRQGREVESRGPAFGPVNEIGEVGPAELDAGGPGNQFSRLPGSEVQLGCTDLNHVPGAPQPGQWQRGINPGDQHELDG